MSVANALNVKDFVIDILEKQKEIQTKKQQQKKQTAHTYNVILQNNIDFVINRKTATTDKNLVFLISQGTFYIQDNKSGDVAKLSEQMLRVFFQNVYYDKFEQLDKVQWWNGSPMNNIEKMISIVRNPTLQKFYQHGIFAEKYNYEKWTEIFDGNIKLFKYCYDKIFNSNNKSNFNSIVKLTKDINDKINYNNAIYFIDKLSESNMRFSLILGYYEKTYEFFLSIIDKYNLNYNRFIEYICYDLYSQGIAEFSNSNFTLYRDYLDMQISLYGHIKEKYPKYLKTEHDIIALKVTIYKKHQQDLMLLNVVDNYKDLLYKTKEYSIVLPQSTIDIVDEGINQSHCVASYVDSVVENKRLVAFMRKTDELDKSLITIDIQNRVVTQAKGFANRPPTKEEIKFLKKWIKEKDLKTDLFKENENKGE